MCNLAHSVCCIVLIVLKHQHLLDHNDGNVGHQPGIQVEAENRIVSWFRRALGVADGVDNGFERVWCNTANDAPAGLAESIRKFKEKDKALHSARLRRFGVCQHHPQRNPRNDNLWRIPGFDAHAEQERSESSRTGDSSILQKPYNGYHSQRESANKRGSNSVRPRFGFIPDSADPRGYASCSIAWKTLQRSRVRP